VGFLSSAQRPSLALPQCSPGAIYRAESSVARQVSSLRPSAPQALIGTSSREGAQLLYTRSTFKPA